MHSCYFWAAQSPHHLPIIGMPEHSRSSHPKVAVVILSWNGRSFLEQFLPAVLKTTYPNCEICVADNASTDDTLPFMREHFPSVRLIALQENTGFAGGYNRALAQVESDYYVLLNQDVETSPGWIEPVIRLMESDTNIAACQPKIRAFHEKENFEYAGAAGGWIDRYGYPFCRGRVFDTIETDRGQYDDVAEIFWATGAAMFVRSKVFLEMGGLDDHLFAHMEEIDLCWRIKNAGYRIRCCPQAVVYHVGGGSLPQGNPRKTYLNFRNNLILLYKNLPAHSLWGKIALRLVLDQLAALRALSRGHTGDWLAIVKAHFHFARDIFKWHQGRRHARQLASAMPNRAGIYPGSIVWQYFLKKRKTFTALMKPRS